MKEKSKKTDNELTDTQKYYLELFGDAPVLVEKIKNGKVLDTEDLFGCEEGDGF